MSSKPNINYNTIHQWITEHLELTQVKEKLIAMNLDEESINIHIREFNKLKYGKRQSTGFILIGVGSFLGFISCVMTMINPVPALCNFFLYGLTSIAICIVLAGLYFVFE